MTRLLCTGDLHFDHGGTYGREPGDRLREQEHVWRRALELSREYNCDAVLFAGDAFEKRRPGPEAMLAFERPLVEHRDAGGPEVLAIPGNHDRSGVLAGYGLQVFSEAGLLAVTSEPVITPVAGVQVAFLPWTPVAHLVAGRNGGDRDLIHQDAALILLDVARKLRGQVDGPCVLLTHFAISGASTPTGLDVGMLREPVLPVDDLAQLGFDAVVAGHIHRPQLIGTPHVLDMERPVFYTGSPMPLNFGEARDEHGVWLLDLLPGGEWETRLLPIESRRFVTLDVDYTDGDDFSMLFERYGDWADPAASPVTDAIVKVRIKASEEQARKIDVPAIRRALVDVGAYNVWQIALDVERPERARAEGLDEHVDDEQAFAMWLEAQGVNGSRGDQLAELNRHYIQEAR